MKRILFLDVETTGLSIYKGDRVIELGCVEVIEGKITGRIFHSFFNPKIKISNEAYKIHGINNDFLNDKPFFSEKIDEFLGFIKNSFIVAHNAKFDIKFISNEINIFGGDKNDLFNSAKFLDSLELSRNFFPRKRNDLESLCKRLKIPIFKGNMFHNALNDAFFLSLVILKMGFFEKKNFFKFIDEFN